MINHGAYIEWEQKDFEKGIDYRKYTNKLYVMQGRYHMCVEDIICHI